MLEAYCDRCKQKFQRGFHVTFQEQEFGTRGTVVYYGMMNDNEDDSNCHLCLNCRLDFRLWLRYFAPVKQQE